MCSVLEPEFAEGADQISEYVESDIPDGAICKKCDINLAVVILRGKDVYCEDCFLIATNHKFRAILGKTRLVRPGDRVLVAYNGNDSTSALIELIRKGLLVDSYKKLRFHVVILYINENILKFNAKYNIELPIHLTKPPFNFTVYVADISQSLNTTLDFTELPATSKSNTVLDAQLITLYQGLLSHTSKQDLVRKLRNNLILCVAKSLNCPWVFLGDIGDDIAATLLNNIVLGRGAHLSLDVGLCDARDPDCKMMRPMKDFTKKEIFYFNYFNNISPISNQSLRQSAKAGGLSSIQNLTDRFLTDLQDNFPSTISTIFRTGEKLSGGCSTQTVMEDNSCAFCKAALDTANILSSSLQATNFSRKISAKGRAYDLEKSSTNPDNGFPVPVDDLRVVEEYLCFGCRNIFRESKYVNLPQDVVDVIGSRKILAYQRKLIEDCLLE